MTLWLRTFGAVYLERDGKPLTGAHTQKRRLALLAYLAAADRDVVSRERIIALLWPESDESSGRHSLSQLFYAIRHDLGPDVLVVDADTVCLSHTVLQSDVRAAESAARAGSLEDAVALHRGTFLNDFHVDAAPELNRWIDEERGRRAHALAQILDRLADRAESTRDWHRAAEWLRRRVDLEPADSRSSVRLMRALNAMGDRDGALRTARVYETLMRQEYEADPDPQVVQLAEQLRRGPAPPPFIEVQQPAEAARSIAAPADTPPARALQGARSPARAWWPYVALAVTALVLVLIASIRNGSRAVVAERSDRGAVVVVGDLEGPDSVLALAAREALRAELVNARGVLLTSDAGMRDLKMLMRLPPGAPLVGPALLSLATRSGAHVALTGSVVPVGAGAQIVVELLEPGSGRALRTFAERPVDGPAILAAVGRIAREIGAAVSNTPRDTSVHALPAVTTASLAALKSYAIARQTAALGKRREAVAPAERAVTHDSAFVLAHYFLGDLLWFIDEQSHSEAHLRKAYDLMATVPRREQLVIRARYEQLANDRPDSALAYWQLVHDASPGDVLAYEGRTWALRALGRHEEAAASADTAMDLDPGAILPNTNNAMYSWFSVGDTASALAVGRRVATRFPEALTEANYYTALYRDPNIARQWAESTRHAESRHWRQHLADVATGNIMAGRATLDSVLADDRVQFPPNAILNQGWLELAIGGDSGRTSASQHARAALEWTRRRDLSPPAIGRLSERIADLAARAGDEATVRATIALVRDRDRGRRLRTYVLAQRTLDAALAFARGHYADAARLANEARHGVYFSRSLSTIAQLEADALRASGDHSAGDSIARLVSTHQIVDGHFEVWLVLQSLTRKRDSASRLLGLNGLQPASRP